MFVTNSEPMCSHLEPLIFESRILFVAVPNFIIDALVQWSELGALAFLGIEWAFVAYGPQSWNLLSWSQEMALVSGILLVVTSIRLPTPRCLVFLSVIITVLGVTTFVSPTLAAAGTSMLVPVVLALVRLMLGAVLPSGSPVLEFGAVGAVPAVPLVLFAVEGYLEPHAKWLTPYDFLLRAVSLGASCWALGAFATVAWCGLAWSTCRCQALLGSAMGALCRAPEDASSEVQHVAVRALRSSVRLSIEDADGKEYSPLTCLESHVK